MRVLFKSFLIFVWACVAMAQVPTDDVLTIEEAQAQLDAATPDQRPAALLRLLAAFDHYRFASLAPDEFLTRSAEAFLELGQHVYDNQSIFGANAGPSGMEYGRLAAEIFTRLNDGVRASLAYELQGRSALLAAENDPAALNTALGAFHSAIDQPGLSAERWTDLQSAYFRTAFEIGLHLDAQTAQALRTRVEEVLNDNRAAANLPKRGEINGFASQFFNANPSGERSENLDDAIRFGRAAASDLEGTDLALSLALIRIELAGALSERAEIGHPALYLEAITTLEAAAEIMTQDAQPLAWPIIKYRRAQACFFHAQAVGSDDYGCAVDDGNAIIAFIDMTEMPELWANTKFLLADVAALQSVQGKPGEAARAEDHLRDIIAAPIRESQPALWAGANLRLAGSILAYEAYDQVDLDLASKSLDDAETVYRSLGRKEVIRVLALRRTLGDRQDELSAREAGADIELTVITGEEFPLTFVWVSAQDTSEPDLRKLRQSADAIDQEAAPHEWATQVLDSAEAQLAMETGDRETNRKLAERAVQQARNAIDPNEDRLLWVRAWALSAVIVAMDPNLTPYQARIDAAQPYINAAAEALVGPQDGDIWVAFHLNVANLYLHILPQPGVKPFLDEMLALAEAGIGPDTAPHLRTAILRTAGEVAHRSAWLGDKNYAEAEHYYTQIIATDQLTVTPATRLQVLTHRTWIAIKTNFWPLVNAAAPTLANAVDARLDGARSETAMRSAAAQAGRAASFLALNAVHHNDPESAMAILDRVRAVTTRAVIAGEARALSEGESKRLDEKRAALRTLPNDAGPSFDVLRSEAQEEIFQLTSAQVSSTELSPPAPGTAYLTMTVTAEGGAVILQTATDYYTNLLPRRSFPVMSYLFMTSIGQQADAAWEFGKGEDSARAANDLAVWVWPLLKRANLSDGTRIFWVPPPDLADIPLDAGRDPETGLLLIDKYDVTALPAFALLPLLQARPSRPPTVAGLFDSLGNLQHAGLERALTVASIGRDALNDVEANQSAEDTLSKLEGASIWQFASHSTFDPADYGRSGITLGRDANGGELRLTLEHLLYETSVVGPDLVLLTVCQSAIVDVKHFPEDLTGLPTAFLRLGAHGVISARWDVSDRATALLVGRFFWELTEAKIPAHAALRNAKLWLRTSTATEIRFFVQEMQSEMASDDLQHLHQINAYLRRDFLPQERPFADPIYWAAFSYFGA